MGLVYLFVVGDVKFVGDDEGCVDDGLDIWDFVENEEVENVDLE